jgi:hypothetical protein
MSATNNTIKENSMFDFIVTTTDKRRSTVHASYFKEEGIFTSFKDEKHGIVFMVRNDALHSVERQAVHV